MVEAMLKFPSENSGAFVKDSSLQNDHCYSVPSGSSYENGAKAGRPPSPEVGDWASIEDINSILPVMDGSVSKLLEEESLGDPIDVCDFNWAELESFPDQIVSTDISDSTSAPDAPKREKRRRSPVRWSSSMQWSKMSREDQFGTVRTLTEISQGTTLREQLEIIHVIDPSAVLSSNDTEFAIDLAYLNDDKLQIIMDTVKKQSLMSSNRVLNGKDMSGVQSSIVHPHSTSLTPAPVASKVKSAQEQEDEDYLKEMKLRQRKLLRQTKKEKRSGLFMCEKKIKRIKSTLRDENDDVNILD